MIALTAILRAKPGAEDRLKECLMAVFAHVEAHEPRTVSYFVARDPDEPQVFTTYERFADREAMELHNASPPVAAFFDVAEELLAGDPIIRVTEEIAAKV